MAEDPEDAELYLQTVWIPSGRLTWVGSSDGHYPTNAIKCGQSSSGSDIFTVRASVGGDLLPGILQHGHNSANVAANKNMQMTVSSYEVLCGDNNCTSWVPSCGGVRISNAVIGGYTADGEMVFIGRAHNGGGLIPGKVQPSTGNLTITYYGKYTTLCGYELLVGV